MELAVLLFEDYETLDVFGPVEIFGRLAEHYQVSFYSLEGGPVKNRHGVTVLSAKLQDIQTGPLLLLIPGGPGTRNEVENDPLLEQIRRISELSTFVLTVCTGSALLARTGLLEGRRATSNKRAFAWVLTNGPLVRWDKKARWIVDDKYYTSAGVSAGMDMALGFIGDRHGVEFARRVAEEIEYHWREDRNDRDSDGSPVKRHLQ
jgi:transcriptional regulator GlxA family with amidase domain